MHIYIYIYIYIYSAAAVQVWFKISTRCVFIHAFFELIACIRLVFTFAFISLKNSKLQCILRTFENLSLLEQRKYPHSKISLYPYCLFYSCITLNVLKGLGLGLR